MKLMMNANVIARIIIVLMNNLINHLMLLNGMTLKCMAKYTPKIH